MGRKGGGGRIQHGKGEHDVIYIPTKRGGRDKVLAMLKGGTTSFWVVLTWVLAILRGGATRRIKFPVLKRKGCKKF